MLALLIHLTKLYHQARAVSVEELYGRRGNKLCNHGPLHATGDEFTCTFGIKPLLPVLPVGLQ